MRLIDADALTEDFLNDYDNYVMEGLRGNFHDTIRITDVIERIKDSPTLKREGCCICGADAQMFTLKCSNTKQTLYICWNCAKDIAEQHFPSFPKHNVKIKARWKEVEPRELICTNCGGYAPMNYMHEHYVETAFCPHCGAMNRGKEG